MKSKILGLLAAGLLSCSMTANALIIEITGQGSANGQWDVTTLLGDFDDHFPILDEQVWWGSEMLAEAFAAALNDDLGLPNIFGTGPVFAYGELASSSVAFNACAYSTGLSPDPTPCGATTLDLVFTFAVASRVEEVPVPGTIALLGFGLVGLGLRLSRRRKLV